MGQTCPSRTACGGAWGYRFNRGRLGVGMRFPKRVRAAIRQARGA